MAPKDPRSLPLLNTIVTELSNSVPNLRFISCASSRTWEKCFLRT